MSASKLRDVLHIASCPEHDGRCDGYTSTPTHLRIYREDTGDAFPWHIDGADETGHFTEDVRRYATLEQAVAAMTEFVSDQDGVATFQWRTPETRGCSCGMADYGAPGHDGGAS